MTNLSNGQSPQSNSVPDVYALAKSSVGWQKHPLDIVKATGNDRLDLLQRMTTNDVLKLSSTDTSATDTSIADASGTGVQNVLITDKARIIDVFTVLARPGAVLMLFSSGMGAQVMEWLDKYTFIDDFQTQDISAEYASFLVFGERSMQLLEELTGVNLVDMRQSAWQSARIEGGLDVVIVKQQPLCGFCYTLLVPKIQEEALCDILRGLEGVGEVDDATFETLRIEAAWGKLGAEWTAERNPLEAGLVGLVDFKKGCYIGQEVIARLDTYNKVKMRLSGFLSETPIPQGAHFFDEADGKRTDIGLVTSMTFSRELGRYIALGYIRSQFANPGMVVQAISTSSDGGVETTQKLEIVKLPFVM